MDGDSSARAMKEGASTFLRNDDFGINSVHEDAVPKGEPVGEKTTGTGTSAFSSEGAIGKQFTTGGLLGGAAQKIGGPLDAKGSIGKAFTTDGSIGGSVQEHLGKGETNTFQK